MKDNDEKYWHCVLPYIYGMLSIGIEPRGSIEAIGKYFQMKLESIGPPDICIGTLEVKYLRQNYQMKLQLGHLVPTSMSKPLLRMWKHIWKVRA